MTDDPYRALVADLAAEHADLDRIVAPLTEQAWSTLTPADGWTIRDTILHLALTDEVATLAAADPAAFQAYRERRRRGPDPFELKRGMRATQLVGLWRSHRQQLLDALNSLDPKARITWFGPPMSGMSHATARLMETWAHGQDIVDALGVERVPTARLKHIAHLGVRTRGYSYAQHGLTAPEADPRVELTAPDGTCWTWGDPGAPDRVSGPAVDFCLVVVRRRHLDATSLVVESARAREWLQIAQAYAGNPGAGRQPAAGD